jgi:hypothetical protein
MSISVLRPVVTLYIYIYIYMEREREREREREAYCALNALEDKFRLTFLVLKTWSRERPVLIAYRTLGLC